MKEYLERFPIDFNDKFIMDFDFTNDPQALDGSLRRKKSWISPSFKRRWRARRALAEELNVNICHMNSPSLANMGGEKLHPCQIHTVRQ